jgi:hypothetical protein
VGEINDLIVAREAHIRRAFKRISPKKGFSRSGMTMKRIAVRQSLVDQDHIHPGYDTLNDKRLSAVCPSERFRLDLWVHVEVYPVLFGADEPVYLLTLADRRWQRHRRLWGVGLSALHRDLKPSGLQLMAFHENCHKLNCRGFSD